MRYITEMEKVCNMPIDIEDSLLEKLKKEAEKKGCTPEELIQHIIIDIASVPIDIKDFSINPEKLVNEHSSIILTKDGKPFARVTNVIPLTEIDETKLIN